MYQDDIIAEVWRNRDAFAARHHHSLAEMVADLRAREIQAEPNLVDRRGKTKPSKPDRSASRDAQ